MANYSLNKTVYDKKSYQNTIDTSFNQVQSTPPTPSLTSTVTVNQFFELYNSLFYQIPAEGSINSHRYLVDQSSAYLGPSAIPEDVQALLDEITVLRQDLLTANQQILTYQLSSSLM